MFDSKFLISCILATAFGLTACIPLNQTTKTSDGPREIVRPLAEEEFKCNEDCKDGLFLKKFEDLCFCSYGDLNMGTQKEFILFESMAELHFEGELFHAPVPIIFHDRIISQLSFLIPLHQGEGFELEIGGALYADVIDAQSGAPVMLASSGHRVDSYLAESMAFMGRSVSVPKDDPPEQQKLVRHAQTDELLLLKIWTYKLDPYSFTLKRLPIWDDFAERQEAIASFEAKKGEAFQELTLQGKDFAADFKPYNQTPCSEINSMPTAVFQVVLNQGDTLTAETSCKAADCPVPINFTSGCGLPKLTAEQPTYPAKFEYEAKKAETLTLGFAAPIFCGESNQKQGKCFVQDERFLRSTHLHPDYQIKLSRTRN